MLPRKLVGIHDVFHMPQLKKYYPTPDHVLNSVALELRMDLTYEEKPREVVEGSVKKLRRRQIPIVKLYGD